MRNISNKSHLVIGVGSLTSIHILKNGAFWIFDVKIVNSNSGYTTHCDEATVICHSIYNICATVVLPMMFFKE